MSENFIFFKTCAIYRGKFENIAIPYSLLYDKIKISKSGINLWLKKALCNESLCFPRMIDSNAAMTSKDALLKVVYYLLIVILLGAAEIILHGRSPRRPKPSIMLMTS